MTDLIFGLIEGAIKLKNQFDAGDEQAKEDALAKARAAKAGMDGAASETLQAHDARIAAAEALLAELKASRP